MSDYYDNPTGRNHFPIIMQLAILAVILGGIFSTFLVEALTKEHVSTDSQAPAPLSEQSPATLSISLEVDEQALVADAAFIYDVNTDTVLYTHNGNEALPLASITKLMTALVAYELVSEETTAAIPMAAIMQEGSSGFTAGEVLSLQKLSQMALVSSSNDAAYTLAASVGSLLGEQDATQQFVTAMNIRAEELGLSTLQFYNMTGLDISTTEAGAFGSAADISKLMAYIVKHYPEMIAPTTETSTRVYNESGQYHEVENTNDVITQIPNVIGSKTGFTDLAGGNLTVAFDIGLNRPIVVTVLGSTYEDRFSDVLTLVKATQSAINIE